MALTAEEKAAVRLYTGRSDQFRDLDTTLESQLDSVSPAAEAQVRVVLSQLAAIDAKIQSAALNNMDLERAEDVTFRGPEQLLGLMEYGRSLIQRLCVIFHIQPTRDYYGTEASSGGVIPLG